VGWRAMAEMGTSALPMMRMPMKSVRPPMLNASTRRLSPPSPEKATFSAILEREVARLPTILLVTYDIVCGKNPGPVVHDSVMYIWLYLHASVT
jgi:hypothetical protein